MKHSLLLFFVGIVGLFQASAQDTSTVNLDLLKAPSSPGFILLNQQPTDIERPTNPTDFAIGLRNSTNNFSAIPQNYAVELAPCWLLGGKKLTFEKTYAKGANKNIGRNIWQSLSLSTAINTNDTAANGKNTQAGLGIKFSIVRGEIDDAFYDQVNKLEDLQAQVGQSFAQRVNALMDKDSSCVALRKMMRANPNLAAELAIALQKIANQKGELVKDSLDKVYKDQIQKLSNIQLTRYGWFLDAAGGMVIDFPGQVFENAESHRFGAWLTGGYEGRKHFSLLGVARWLATTQLMYQDAEGNTRLYNNNALDAGGRLVYDNQRFSVSLEGLFRSNLNTIKNYDSWKATFCVTYDLGMNKLLTFNLSRDFDGQTTKKGNVIAALNLILGFGSKRSLK